MKSEWDGLGEMAKNSDGKEYLKKKKLRNFTLQSLEIKNFQKDFPKNHMGKREYYSRIPNSLLCII